MTEDKKTPTIEFAPGCFDHFEGSQEELDQLMAEIMQMVESGDMVDNSTEITEDNFDDLPDEVKESLLRFFNDEEAPKRNLQ
jgi:DNA gyrase inhibitor GyrI